MGNVFPGYRGLASIGGVGEVRFSDASIAAKQTVNAPDLVMGDWDHDAYNYGPIEVGGSISGPVTETFVSGSGGGTGLFGWGVTRTAPCGLLTTSDVDLFYYCNEGGGENNARLFTGMLVNSLGFSCAAGDVAQFTLDILGSGTQPWRHATPTHFTTAEKLITWDKVNVSIVSSPEGDAPSSSLTLAYSNFDFTIGNNLQTVYSLGQPNLFPFEIVPGLRTITGTLSVYNTPEANGFDRWDDYIAANVSTLRFDIGGITIDMRVRFHRLEPALGVAPIVSSVGFTGVSHQTGTPWEA